MIRHLSYRSLLLASTVIALICGPSGAQVLGETLDSGQSRLTQPRQVTSSVDQSLQDPGAAVPSDYSTVGDNLGNHIAIKDMNLSGNDLIMQGGNIQAEGGRVLGIQEVPTETDEASSKFYVDSLNTDLSDAITIIEGDVETLFNRRINTPANQGLQGGGPLTSDLTLIVDGTVVRTSGDQVVSGVKSFVGSVDLRGNRLLGVGTPSALTDGVNKGYVDGATNALGEEIDTLTETFFSRRIDTGTGLLGGGDLSINRVLTFDTSWGDGRYVVRSRTLTAGDGLTGGGDLSANRTFALDATVVRTSGNQTVAGNKTFTGLLAFSNGRLTSVGAPIVASDAATKGYVDGVRADLESGLIELTNRRIDTGTGLLGGGDLSQNRLLTFDTTWGDTRYAIRDRILSAGDGISGGGNLAADRSFSVDATVVRTSGTQMIAGEKSFRQGTGTRFDRGLALDSIVMRGGATGTSGYAVTITPGSLTANRVLTLADGATTLVAGTMVPTTRSLSAGDGLTGGGDFSVNRALAVDGSVVRTSGDQTVAGAKTFTGILAFSNNRLTLVGTPTAVSDAATKGYVDGLSASLQADISALFARKIDTGTGLLGGGDLSADRIISFDTTWGDIRYALRDRTISAGDGLVGGGSLAANRSFAVDGTVVRTARSLTTGTGLTGGGDLSVNRSFAFDTAWGDARYATLATAQTISGAKTFSASANFSNLRVLGVATPTLGTDAANKAYVDAAAGAAVGTTYTAGTGLTLTGSTFSLTDLASGSADIGAVRYNGTTAAPGRFFGGVTAPTNTTRLNYDGALYATQLFDAGARVVGQTRTLTAGDGLSGGGDLSANRSFAVDTTVVRTTRTLTAGAGLTGGGDLSANRTVAFDAVWGDARYATLATAQTISGAKTFSASANFSNLRVLGVATPTLGTDAANKAYVDAAAGAAVGTTYTAGTGLTLTGTTFALADNQIRRGAMGTLTGVVAFNGDTPADAQFYGGSTNPTSTNNLHRVNFQGSIYATRFYATQYFYFSDETLKENVNRIGGAEGMELIREIRPVRYDWKETGREALGVIAQETARVLPNLVDTDPNGIMSVDYIQLIAPLIAAVQELDARVTVLEAAKAERSSP